MPPGLHSMRLVPAALTILSVLLFPVPLGLGRREQDPCHIRGPPPSNFTLKKLSPPPPPEHQPLHRAGLDAEVHHAPPPPCPSGAPPASCSVLRLPSPAQPGPAQPGRHPCRHTHPRGLLRRAGEAGDSQAGLFQDPSSRDSPPNPSQASKAWPRACWGWREGGTNRQWRTDSGKASGAEASVSLLDARSAWPRPPPPPAGGGGGQQRELARQSRVSWWTGRQMSASMETVGSGEVAPGAPEPTRIDVHIHQESALATLLVRACSQLRSPTPDAISRTGGRSRLLVASWVVQIVLGALSGALGGFLYFFHLCTLRDSGAAIWTGAVAVLAGAVAFIYEKRGGIYWALLRTLLALATFSTTIAAVVIGARYFHEYKFHFRDYICQVSSTGLSWAATPRTTPSPEETRRLHLCLSYLSMLKALFISFQAMLLGVWVLLFLASLVPLCLCCWRRSQRKKETDQKKLLEVRETQLCFS